jgi:hypothetical protein
VAAKVIQELLRWYSHLHFLGAARIADVLVLADGAVTEALNESVKNFSYLLYTRRAHDPDVSIFTTGLPDPNKSIYSANKLARSILRVEISLERLASEPELFGVKVHPGDIDENQALLGIFRHSGISLERKDTKRH